MSFVEAETGGRRSVRMCWGLTAMNCLRTSSGFLLPACISLLRDVPWLALSSLLNLPVILQKSLFARDMFRGVVAEAGGLDWRRSDDVVNPNVAIGFLMRAPIPPWPWTYIIRSCNLSALPEYHTKTESTLRYSPNSVPLASWKLTKFRMLSP